jgi:outer membrane protein TolC
MDQRIDYAESRRWTHYLTLDPLTLVQNLLGGGDIQRDHLAIADLEIQAADLVRRREEVAEHLAREVVGLVLDYEQLGRELALLESQMQTQQLQVAVMEAGYRTGQGDTVTMLGVWQRTEDLQIRQQETRLDQAQVQRKLEQIVDTLPPLNSEF